MAEDDIDREQPRAPRRPPAAPPGLAFSRLVTLSLSLLLISVLAVLSLPSGDSARLSQMEKPVETAERVFERDLWIEDAVATFPEWSRNIVEALVDAGPPTREEAVRAFADILAKNGYPAVTLDSPPVPVDPVLLDGVRARRTVLLADIGRIEEAEGDMQRLIADGHATFVDAVKRAWSRVRSDDVRPFGAYDIAIAGDDWIGKHLQHRLAVATGSDAARDALERAIAERRDAVAARLRLVVMALLVPLLAGFLVLLYWIARNRPQGVTSTAELPPSWTFQSGYAVVVRSAFGAIGVAFVLWQSAEWLAHGGSRTAAEVVTAWGTLFMAVPMLWFVRRRLLAVSGQSFSTTFGLASFPRPVWWIGFTLAMFAVDQLGVRAILDLFRMGGMGLHWSEGFASFAIWEHKALVIANSVDVCAWSPIFEEVGFRGLLYATLRRHYGPWQAALLSASVFGAAHVRSLPDLVCLTWSGLVYAVAFERCKSLMPGILCSAFASAFAIAEAVLLYR